MSAVSRSLQANLEKSGAKELQNCPRNVRKASLQKKKRS
jgi:hypothetical protein